MECTNLDSTLWNQEICVTSTDLSECWASSISSIISFLEYKTEADTGKQLTTHAK